MDEERASGLNLVLGIGVHAAKCKSKLLECSPAECITHVEFSLHFPLYNESQNSLKFFPSPGNRHARLVMAIGILLLLLLAIVTPLNLIFVCVCLVVSMILLGDSIATVEDVREQQGRNAIDKYEQRRVS